MSKWLIAVFALAAGLGLGYFLPAQIGEQAETTDSDVDKPLYWVAPMDPNYQRDKPGLSPMGMELVPVYAEDLVGGDSPGTVTISPEVTNNLGVRVAPVIFSPLQARIETVGYIQFDEERIIDVHSRISGWIEKLAVNTEGERVKKGQLLYEIYSPELVNAQEEYIAALASGNRYLQKASRSKLKALGVSENVIDLLRTKRRPLLNIPVHASISGFISQLNLRQGMYIKPASRLMRIGPLDEVWVIAELFERQASQVAIGDEARMELEFAKGRQWRGKVDYIYPALNPKTRTLKVRLRFANPDLALKPEMFARIQLQSQPTPPVLNIAADALISTGTQERVVLDLGEGRYKSIAVKTGVRVGDRVAVLQGLYPEDKTVISAQFMLDSESSISSDFVRMTPPQMGFIEEVWVAAEIENLDIDERLVTLRHGEISEWNQPAMLMELPLDDSIDVNALAQARSIQVLLNGGDMSDLRITDFILPRPKAPGSFPGGQL